MKNYLERFIGNPHSFQRKIITIYIVLTVVPILLIATIITGVYYRRILNSAYNILNQNAQQHETIVQERMENYENVMYELVADSEFIASAKTYNVSDSVDGANIRKIFSNSISTYDQIRAAIFLSDSGKYISYSRWYGSRYDSIWSDAKVRTEIYNVVNGNQALTFIATVNIGLEEVRDDQAILMGFPVRDLRTQEQSGIVILALTDNCLLFNNENESSVKGVETVIVDDHDKIIAGTEDKFINMNLDSYLEKIYQNVSSLETRKYQIQSTEWAIVHIIDRAVYRKDIYHTLWAVMIIVAIVVVIICILVWMIFGRYIGNIQKIAQSLRNYEGKQTEELKVDVNKEDELYTIVRQFNKMTVRINHLVETLEKKNIEIQEAAISQKHAEIKALEAQINPHFLFNTLDSINWRAIENDEEEISDMLATLGSLLRYSVSNIENMVYLEAEISWLKKYVFLQRDRFQNSFDCVYDITEEAMGFPVYKMLLQPIIENTILHAFENVKEGGMINIEAHIKEDGKLEIHIGDNGCGMDTETLERIRKEIGENGALNSESIGISNVIHRLRIYYQEEAEIIVESTPGMGTEFVLIIPRKDPGIIKA